MDRYCRNTAFPGIGKEGQERLFARHVAIVGVGALGGTLAMHMVRAGVGTVTICDHDTVDLTNIARQLLYDEDDVGTSKVRTAEKKLRRMNSDVEVRAHDAFLDESTAPHILGGADLVLDGTDRMAPRYVMNAYCVAHGVPYVYAGVLGGHGMLFNVVPADGTACFACIFPRSEAMERVPTCAEAGIVNTVPAIMASMQATEALKLLIGAPYTRDLVVYDAWKQSFDRVRVRPRPSCGVCGR